jgi:antitoxin VapB
MAMNIKNPVTEKLVQELASLTGETLTTAITESVRERLQRAREAEGSGLAERLIKIGKDCAAHLPEPHRSVDPAELLYDEKGLPR